MSSFVQEQLKATGIAQVIVVLKAPAPAAASRRRGVAASLAPPSGGGWESVAAGLDRYFITPERSQPQALRRAAATAAGA